MVITILAIGFVGIVIGTSVPHNPHPHAHAHQVHVAPPPVVHRHHSKRVVVVKSKPAPKKGHNQRPARKHHKR